MQDLIIQLMDKFGYIGIMLLIAIENIFPPIPSEVVLTFGGFMTTYSKLTIIGVIIFSTVGAILGAIVLYYIGRILNKERLMRIVSGKIGKILFLKVDDIEKADRWFATKGDKVVFFGRCVPIIRSLISIPAGMSGMPLGRFLILTTIGSAIWNTILVIIGSVVGESWEKIVAIVNEYA
ncbi:MAG TPA: alkaline phosphatase, partial [Lachnospiraceae bacterium]|uniref:DedA family protein n=1 Tax=Anaerosporobacter sp. TaxID=1872529 RepID=UPI000EC841BF